MGGGPINRASKALSGEPLILRRATKDDLDDITWIVRDGSPDDPGTDYRFPYRDKYPADFWKWTRVEYEEYFDRPDKLVVLVVTAPILDDGQTIHQPVSVGVWDVAVTSDFIPGGTNPHHIPSKTHNRTLRPRHRRKTRRKSYPYENLRPRLDKRDKEILQTIWKRADWPGAAGDAP